jgi:hypothetical protein
VDRRRTAAQVDSVGAAAHFGDRDGLVAEIDGGIARRIVVERDAGKAGEERQLVDVKGAGAVQRQDVVAAAAGQLIARIQCRGSRIDGVVAARPDNRIIACRKGIGRHFCFPVQSDRMEEGKTRVPSLPALPDAPPLFTICSAAFSPVDAADAFEFPSLLIGQ